MSFKFECGDMGLGERRYRGRSLIVFSILSLIILTGCSKYSEPAPFFDGLFLKYKTKYSGMLGSSEYRSIYEITALTDGFKVVHYTDFDKEDIDEMILDPYGKIKEEVSPASFLYALVFSSRKLKEQLSDKYSDIWLPTSTIDVGDKINGGTIVRKEHWREWDIMVLSHTIIPIEFYFDVDTGYRVGMKLNDFLRSEQALVETNEEIAVEEEF